MIKYNDSGNKFIYKKGLARSQPYVNRQNRKPVSVLICHLSSRSTPRKRAGSPLILADIPVYMIFLVLVPSPPYVAIRRRELLPRGFTLTLSGGLFSVTASIRLLPSVLSTAGALSSPDFPLSFLSDRSVLPIISMSYLYPSFRSIMSFSLSILSTSFFKAGVMSSQCL